MTFNEANVNRLSDGKFGEKTGSPATADLTPTRAETAYNQAQEAYWDHAVPAYSRAQTALQDAQLVLVSSEILAESPDIVRAEVRWDDEWKSLGRPHRFYDKHENEVFLTAEPDTSLDEFDDYDNLRRGGVFTETESGDFSFIVERTSRSDAEVEDAYNEALYNLRSARQNAQNAQLRMLRAEIKMKHPDVVSAEVGWDEEWGALGRPDQFYDKDGNEVDFELEPDTPLDMWDSEHDAQLSARFEGTEEDGRYRFQV